MLNDVLPHFGHGLTDGHVVVENVSVLLSIPVDEVGELLGNGVEEANDNTDRCRFHVLAELVDRNRIGHAVVAVELHLLPDGKKNGRQHEDGGPVLQPLSAIYTGVQGREFLENVLLKFSPHIGHGTLDLEVDHNGSDDPAVELGLLVVDLSLKLDLGALALNKGNVKGEVVSKDKLEGLSNDRRLLLHVVAVSSGENLGDEWCALEMVDNEFFEGPIDVLVEILGEGLDRDTLSANIELLGLDVEVDWLLLGLTRLDPLKREAAGVGNIHLADGNGKGEPISMGDPHQRLFRREPLDVEDRDAAHEVSLVIGLPILHEVADILNIDTSARHLPETSMRRLAASTWLAFVASLLEEFASETGTEFPDFTSLLALLWEKRSSATPNLLFTGAVLLASGRSTNDRFRGLGDRALPGARVSPAGTRRGRRGSSRTAGWARAARDRRRRLDSHGANSDGRADDVVCVVGDVHVIMEAVAVRSRFYVAIGIRRERRVREWRHLLETTNFHRVGTIGRVGVGTEVQRLARVEDCGILRLTQLVKARSPVYQGPSLADRTRER